MRRHNPGEDNPGEGHIIVQACEAYGAYASSVVFTLCSRKSGSILDCSDPRFLLLLLQHTFTFQLLDKPWSQVSSLLLPGSCLQFLSRIDRVQQSHCSSIVHRMLLTHALALSASQFVHKKKFQGIYTSMHSAGLELTKLTYTRLEGNLIRHRGDRFFYVYITRSTYHFAYARQTQVSRE